MLRGEGAVKSLGRDSTCRSTSAEAGRKPKPVGAFSSSSTPFTPGLKWSSTWKRSSEEMSFKEGRRGTGGLCLHPLITH